MYNIGPLDRLNRLFQRLSSEGGYWLRRIQRLIPGQGSKIPEIPNVDVKGTPLLPIVVAGCLLIGCCLCVVVLGIAYYVIQNGL